MKDGKIPYICGPLTGLHVEVQKIVKRFYSDIANICEKAIGKRAFVPHEHYDPIKHSGFSSKDVDVAEREQVCEKASLLIVVAIYPSWGGGIEVEMAYRSGVPAIVLCELNTKISRLLLGNPSVKTIIYYKSEEDALEKLEQYLEKSRKLGSTVFDYCKSMR